MNTFDIILLIFLLYGFIRGIFKGLFVEVASLLALILGIYGAIYFSDFAGNYLHEAASWNKKYISIASFVLTFIIIVIVITLLGKFFTKIADLASLGLLNKLFGGIFGLLKMTLITSILLFYFQKFNGKVEIVSEETLQESMLYESVKEMAGIIFPSFFEKSTETTTTDSNKNTEKITQ
ncbi:MAG: CvpA family protein [Flavobacteriaceae bacterium]|nr:CvpA family protein [Flavobacteriaceae bacterium]